LQQFSFPLTPYLHIPSFLCPSLFSQLHFPLPFTPAYAV